MAQKEKKENFRGFRVSDFVLYPKSETQKPWKDCITSKFDSSCNLR